MLSVQTPALLVDIDAFQHNLSIMAEARPGPQLRPHVKAHKCTELARRQMEAGHHHFCCATLGEMEAMARIDADCAVRMEAAQADLQRLERQQRIPI